MAEGVARLMGFMIRLLRPNFTLLHWFEVYRPKFLSDWIWSLDCQQSSQVHFSVKNELTLQLEWPAGSRLLVRHQVENIHVQKWICFAYIFLYVRCHNDWFEVKRSLIICLKKHLRWCRTFAWVCFLVRGWFQQTGRDLGLNQLTLSIDFDLSSLPITLYFFFLDLLNSHSFSLFPWWTW